MKAITIKDFGGIDKLSFEELPTPNPADNEVQIQIVYTAVNPVDWKIREGFLKERLPHKFPLILGWDASGIITLLGKNVKNFKVGDEVYAYCRKPTIQWGTYAEYVCFDAKNVALKPKNINFAQAAALPLVALVAWQALFDAAKLKKGETILINAGSGGVGSMAIQFAKNTGARVLATAHPSNHAYIKKLGAEAAIDYTNNLVEQVKKLAPQGVDVLFDAMGGKALRDTLQIIKPKGRLVSIVEILDSALAAKHNIDFQFVFVAPNGDQLAQIANLIEQNKITVPNIEEMPLKDAAKAQEKIREGHTKGKIVLKVK
jgi:NADPH:quinone reductase-like Zn-dependent oxidoreductase